MRLSCRSLFCLPLCLLLAACSATEGTPAPSDDAGTTCPTDTVTSKVDTGEVQLNMISLGCGPHVVLLHGFPEFSFSWSPLFAQLPDDVHLVAPDQRGYAPSTIPSMVESYAASRLVADTLSVIKSVSKDPVVLVGHDWGGIVAWLLASQHPEVLRGLVIMNGPHPDIFRRELLQNPDQKVASQYINGFLGGDAELKLSADNYKPLLDPFGDLLSTQQADRYRKAWATGDTLTGGLNWYRANFIQGPEFAQTVPSSVKVTVPTLVLWGMKDTALLPGNLEGLEEFVPKLTVKQFPEAGHFLQYEEPEAVLNAIREFEKGL